MKNLLIIITLTFSTITFAGPGHGHSHAPKYLCKKLATKDLKTSSVAIGKCHVSRLVKSGKINSSWSSSKHTKSIKKDFKGKKEWVVSFSNAKGVKGKNLYIFLNLDGSFVAANFTGK